MEKNSDEITAYFHSNTNTLENNSQTYYKGLCPRSANVLVVKPCLTTQPGGNFRIPGRKSIEGNKNY